MSHPPLKKRKEGIENGKLDDDGRHYHFLNLCFYTKLVVQFYLITFLFPLLFLTILIFFLILYLLSSFITQIDVHVRGCPSTFGSTLILAFSLIFSGSIARTRCTISLFSPSKFGPTLIFTPSLIFLESLTRTRCTISLFSPSRFGPTLILTLSLSLSHFLRVCNKDSLHNFSI